MDNGLALELAERPFAHCIVVLQSLADSASQLT